MNSTLVEFNGLGNSFRIEWDSVVDGEQAELQRAILNIETRSGSDPIVTGHGTALIAAAGSGATYNSVAAQHACNFAAIDTLFFIASTGYGDMSIMTDLTIIPTLGVVSRMSIDLAATFK